MYFRFGRGNEIATTVINGKKSNNQGSRHSVNACTHLGYVLRQTCAGALNPPRTSVIRSETVTYRILQKPYPLKPGSRILSARQSWTRRSASLAFVTDQKVAQQASPPFTPKPWRLRHPPQMAHLLATTQQCGRTNTVVYVFLSMNCILSNYL